MRYLLLLIEPPKGVHPAFALPFTAPCAPKGSAIRSCVTFCCSLSPQRECIPLLRYLLLLSAPQKGVHSAHALPFATLCSPKGSAFRFCVTFCYSPRPQRECILLMRYLSLLIEPQKGVHFAHALPFATLCSPKGSAFRFCVTFCYSPRPQRECILLMRYLSLLIEPQKGVHFAHALPFTAHCASKGSHFAHALPSLLPAPPKGVHSAHALPFAAH